MKKVLLSFVSMVLLTNINCQEKFTDPRDGNIYKTITIEGKIWISENLRYKALQGAYFFDNDPNNIPVYGVLYEWKTATKACPSGWHLPSGSEFQMLVNNFDRSETWDKKAPGPSAFGIQLAGMQDYEGIFAEIGESGYYWTSTEYDINNAEYFSYLLINKMQVIDISRKADVADIHGSEKSNKYSVRCVKN